jgi:hypothetical protein
MTRQCAGCGTLLPEEGRSPRCPRCWAERERQRNLEKVQAFRQRRRDYRPTLNGPEGPHLPNKNDLGWLQWLNLDLVEPIRNVCELIRRGKAPYHDDVLAHARVALERYDGQREEFEARVLQAPQAANLWNEWRSFFEQFREAVE